MKRQSAPSMILCLLFCGLPISPAFGQTPLDPPVELQRRLGPLYWRPIIAIQETGVDSNVFNELENPKRDFTLALAPEAPFWMRLGRARLSGTVGLTYVHYQKYTNQRALNTRGALRLELPLNRITPYIADSIVNAKERPGFEIDARARRLENALTLGTDVRVGARSTVGIAVYRNTLAFDDEEVFLGTFLRDVLNRKLEGVRLSLRRRVTPLTTFAIDTEAQRDRFDFSADRDADSVRVVAGVDLAPFALISGNGRFGYRKFDPLGPELGGFRGFVASGDFNYSLRAVTRFTVHTERDVAYSYDLAEPYYLQTGGALTVTQKITPRWDVQATGSVYRLDYRRAGTGGLELGRSDSIRTFGGGVGYALGPGTRFGVNVNKNHRRSDNSTRRYDGVRVGAGISYGF